MEKFAFVFDFDSTIVSIESFEQIAGHTLQNSDDKDSILQQITEITNQSMQGKIPVSESILRRSQIINIKRGSFDVVTNQVLQFLTPRIDQIIKKIFTSQHDVYIISGGFLPVIKPVADFLGVKKDKTFAFEPVFNAEDDLVSIQNPIDENGLKSKIIDHLKQKNPDITKWVIIGDGANDLEAFTEKSADLFIGFGLHQVREIVKNNAPIFVTEIDEFEKVIDSML